MAYKRKNNKLAAILEYGVLRWLICLIDLVVDDLF